MPAPTAVESHGAAALRGVVNEPAAPAAPALMVEEFTFEDGRAVEKVKDVDAKTIRTKGVDPHVKMTLKGQASLLTGLVAQNTGTKVATLGNFAAAINGYDPAVGSLICMSNKSSQAHIQDQLKVDISIEHLPFVVDA